MPPEGFSGSKNKNKDKLPAMEDKNATLLMVGTTPEAVTYETVAGQGAGQDYPVDPKAYALKYGPGNWGD